MELTILEMLYVVLIVFISVIGTLLTIVLLRVLKVLWVVMELVNAYNKVKHMLSIYAHIPEIIIEKIKEMFSKKSVKEESGEEKQ